VACGHREHGRHLIWRQGLLLAIATNRRLYTTLLTLPHTSASYLCWLKRREREERREEAEERRRREEREGETEADAHHNGGWGSGSGWRRYNGGAEGRRKWWRKPSAYQSEDIVTNSYAAINLKADVAKMKSATASMWRSGGWRAAKVMAAAARRRLAK